MRTDQSQQSRSPSSASLTFVRIACLSLTVALLTLLGVAVATNTTDRLLAAESAAGPTTASQRVTGTVVMIAESTWVVRDGNGKGVLLQISATTKIEGPVAVGDTVEAQVSPDGRALAIKKVH